MDDYNIPEALSDILPFLDDASNWYVRRSRRRFWKSDDDGDKQAAYKTLHYVLTQLSLVMAPFTPFLAEELFLKLTGGELGESVHLLDWPKPGRVDESIVERMDMVRKYIELGLRQRAEKGIKVRQPLASAQIYVYTRDWLDDSLLEIIQEELNVKAVTQEQTGVNDVKDFKIQITLDDTITPELKREGMVREVIRNVQQARKAAGLQVDDRISLQLASEAAELSQAIEEHKQTILDETLATGLVDAVQDQFATSAKVEGEELQISLSKA